MVRRHRATGIVVAVLLVAACASTPDVLPSPTPTSSITTGTEGISLEEASELGVLTGDHDALLDGPVDVREEDGCVVADVELRNVGTADDHYEIEVTPGDATVQPSAVAVPAGEQALLEVTMCADEPVVLTATSRGRAEPVAQLDLDS
ncbi:hypothetical protein [Salsipaludibacter albus]|uniref:hypothetical protein n=1 Tax=Salsipaludibacter albus TaxID=2849650 RepID=UPI001EE4584E|nr:hypothetical protein [Salsipaludibacter albus]MBY5162058.1 hypothetical protein [Salsipaludibacter albus]